MENKMQGLWPNTKVKSSQIVLAYYYSDTI